MRQTVYVDDRLDAADRTAYVSPSFDTGIYTDDENTHRFSTIQAAIDFAYAEWGPVTDLSDAIVIKVGPGIYTEQIHSYDGIIITSYSSGFDPFTDPPPATLYNTGVDSAHYPLRSDEDEYFVMVGIHIKTDTGGVIGKIPMGDFSGCLFTNGHFIERNSSNLVIFNTCSFVGSSYGGFYLIGTGLTGYRNIILRNHCSISFNVTPILTSTHTLWANFKWNDVDLEGAVDIGGDWEWRLTKCYIYRLAQRNNIDTSGEVYIIDSIILNGLHFVSNPLSFSLVNSSFEGVSDNKIPAGEADITADVTITSSKISGVVMHNGLDGEIQITDPIKHVGGNAMDRYCCLQGAINSIAVTGVVDLNESYTGLAELIIPANTNVTIDGHKLYSLTFTGDVVELNANEQLVFFGLARITGGNIEVNGNSSYVGFEECLTVAAYITLTSGTGTYCLVYTSTIKGKTGHPAITLNNTDTVIVSGYSRIDGGVGHPAILITVEADGNIKLKYSTLIHGDNGANAPLIYTGANKVDISVYSCALNAVWNADDFTNLIGSPNNTADAQINF